MQKLKYRFLIVIAALAISAVFYRAWGPSGYVRSDRGEKILETFPMEIGGWKGTRAALEEKVYQILETDIVMVNRYVNGKETVNMSLVYYPEAKVEFHSPEGCNRGTGDIVEKLGSRKITVRATGSEIPLRLNAFVVQRKTGEKDLFYYFFKSGDFVGDSYIGLRLRIAMRLLQASRTSGALIVFSTHMLDDPGMSERILEKFIGDIYPSISVSI